MSKFSKITLIIGTVFILIALVLGAFDYDKIFGPFIENNKSYEQKEKIIDNFKLKEILVNTSNESVTIKFVNRSDIKITYYESKTSKYEIKETDTILSIIKKEKFYINFLNFDFSNPKVVIEIPSSKVLSYNIKTSNAGIKITNGNITNSVFKTSNSNVTLKDVRGRNIDVKTSNGRITLDDVIGNEITLKTSNGGLRLNKVRAVGSIYGHTSNGSIKFSDLKTRDIDFKTSNADISGNIIGKETNYQRDLKTSNSNITINGIGYANKVKDTNVKNDKLILHTSNGDIKVKIK